MNLDELNDRLDAMQAVAAGSFHPMPGLIRIFADVWGNDLVDVRAVQGGPRWMRHRETLWQVSSGAETEVLTRGQTGERGAPYRDLTPTASLGRCREAINSPRRSCLSGPWHSRALLSAFQE